MLISISHLSKSYGGLAVLNDLSLDLIPGNFYCLMSPSGSGKTTLFRILLGLERADSGQIKGLDGLKISAVFQEDRLCQEFTAVDNTAMVLPSHSPLKRQDIKRELSRILPEESLSRPVSTLSGGMKRRAAIGRALLVPFHMLIMDEPFTGLDEDSKKNVISYIKEKTSNKLVLISTHTPEDVSLLGGIPITLS
ncbi:MAG TPA: ABC transporter ATP-binding protein [Candidatus Hungatella pullicola]|nr:ABC transporter ATP-binding protein [Candidatus Hungatella pullicola]